MFGQSAAGAAGDAAKPEQVAANLVRTAIQEFDSLMAEFGVDRKNPSKNHDIAKKMNVYAGNQAGWNDMFESFQNLVSDIEAKGVIAAAQLAYDKDHPQANNHQKGVCLFDVVYNAPTYIHASDHGISDEPKLKKWAEIELKFNKALLELLRRDINVTTLIVASPEYAPSMLKELITCIEENTNIEFIDLQCDGAYGAWEFSGSFPAIHEAIKKSKSIIKYVPSHDIEIPEDVKRVLEINAENNAKMKAAKATAAAADMKKEKAAQFEEFKKQQPEMHALISAHVKQEYEQTVKAQVDAALAAFKEQMKSQVDAMVNAALAKAGLSVAVGNGAAADTKEANPTLLAQSARFTSEWSPMAAAGSAQQPPAAGPSKKPGSGF